MSNEAYETTHIVLIKAIRVHNYGNGIVGIELPGQKMLQEDTETLHRLFPMLTEEAYNLLTKEALLASLYVGGFPQSGQHDVIECMGEGKVSNNKKKKDKEVCSVPIDYGPPMNSY